MAKSLHKTLLTGLLTFGVVAAAQAVPTHVVDKDPSGVGLNDKTKVQPVGGNSATTLGGQRMAVIQKAAEILGNDLQGTVPIVIDAQTDSNACSGNTATIVSGGAVTEFQNFNNAPQKDTFYPVALANQFAGKDLLPDNNASGDPSGDITITINRSLGTSKCLSDMKVYYGLDDNSPPSSIDLLAAVVQQMIRGLGFSSAMNPQTGVFSIGNPTSFDRLIKIDDNTQDKGYFVNLSPSARLAAATHGGRFDYLYIAGKHSVAGAKKLLVQRPLATPGPALYTPGTIQPGVSLNYWSKDLVPTQIMQPQISDDSRPAHGLGLATCALEDIGWTLTDDTSCPDGQNSNAITITPKYADAGTVASGHDEDNVSFGVYSTSGKQVTINSYKIEGSGYKVNNSNCTSQPLDSRQFCGINVDFTATTPGIHTAKLIVDYADGQTVTANLEGEISGQKSNNGSSVDNGGNSGDSGSSGSDNSDHSGGGGGCSMASSPQPLDPTLWCLFICALGVLGWRHRRRR